MQRKLCRDRVKSHRKLFSDTNAIRSDVVEKVRGFAASSAFGLITGCTRIYGGWAQRNERAENKNRNGEAGFGSVWHSSVLAASARTFAKYARPRGGSLDIKVSAMHDFYHRPRIRVSY